MGGSFSRRGLLSLGGAALAGLPLPALARGGISGGAPIGFPSSVVRNPAANPPVPTAAGEQNIQGQTDPDQRMTIDGTIDGHGPFRFVVDTGAERSIVSDDVATALGLGAVRDVIVQGIARSVPAQAVLAKEMQFGEMMIEDMLLPVLPRAWLNVDGYLGLDAINGFRVKYDFPNKRLTIAAPGSGWQTEFLHANEAVVRADGSGGRLKAVDCHVDRIHSYAFIDSGAEASIGNSALFAELMKLGSSYASNEIMLLTGVTGGSIPGRIVNLNSVRLGALNFANGSLIISDLPVFDVWGLGDKPALFLGMNYLRQSRSVTIDYGRQEYRFQIADIRLASRS